MYRQQLSLVVLLTILAVSLPVSGSEPVAADAGSGSTLSGRLAHNSADQNGVAPYAIVDPWGVVCGYVAPRQGLELEPYLNRQVTLQGTMKVLSGGDMPRMTVEKVIVGGRAAKPAGPQAIAKGPRPSPVRPVAHQEMIQTPQTQSRLAPMPSDSSKPREPSVGPPQFSDLPGRPLPRARAAVRRKAAGRARPVDHAAGRAVQLRAVRSMLRASEPLAPSSATSMSILITCSGGCAACMCLRWSPPGRMPTIRGCSIRGGTTILFGNTNIKDQLRSGGRLQFGGWLGECHTVAIEADFFALEQATAHFRDWSDGNPIISRPFINDNGGRGGPFEFVAFPAGNRGSVSGAVNVDALSRFMTTGALLRFATCRQNACWTDSCCNAFHDSFRTDFLLGYRFLRLDDRLQIVEQLSSMDTTGLRGPPPRAPPILLQDQFSTTNEFNGGETGFDFQMQRNRWSLGLVTKIALGNTHETAEVDGFTRNTSLTACEAFDPTGRTAGTDTNSGLPCRRPVRRRSGSNGYPRIPVDPAHRVIFRLHLPLLEPSRPGGGPDRSPGPRPRRITTTGHPVFPSHEHRLLGPRHKLRV